MSLRIYPLDLPPQQIVTDIQLQARLAEKAGFDGCMFAEHHGGFPNYLPNPLLAATWALESHEPDLGGTVPALLAPAAGDPGRRGSGLDPPPLSRAGSAWGCGAGSFPVDFDMAGVPLAELFPRYRQALGVLTEALAVAPGDRWPTIPGSRPSRGAKFR